MKVLGEILKWVLRIGTLGLSLIGEKSAIREYMAQASQCRRCSIVNDCALVNQGYGCNKFRELKI